MATKSLIIQLALLLSLTLSQTPDLVIEMCRHGARAPTSGTYDKSWPPSEYGNLTAKGMRQQFLLGAAIAQEYPTFFPAPYLNLETEILSDNSERCIQSALSQFYGIYLGKGPGFNPNYPPLQATPPYNSEIINQTLSKMNNSYALPFNHYPMEVPYVNDENFIVFDSASSCMMYDVWMAENEFDLKSMEAWTTFHETVKNLNQYGNISTPHQLTEFADTFFCDYIDNRTLPGNMPITDTDLITNMTFAFEFYAAHLWDAQDKQKIITSYGYVSAILNYTLGYVGGNNITNYVLLSGHDSNIVGLIDPMGIYTPDCVMANFKAYWEDGSTPYPNCHFPWFASTLKVELYNTSEPYIKFYYEGNLIPICQNKEACPLNEFVNLMTNLTGNLTFQQYEKMCVKIINDEAHSVSGVLQGEELNMKQNNDEIFTWEIAEYVLICLLVFMTCGLGLKLRNIISKNEYEINSYKFLNSKIREQQ